MLLMNPIRDAGRAAEYFGQSDGGYYLDGKELRRSWGGALAPMLGLTGEPTVEQLDRLLRGLHPLTGEQLTARLADNRTPGTDFTARLPKNVTAAIERGDGRIMPLVERVANEVMADIQDMAAARVRKGGRDDDRVTGLMAWLMVEHAEARPVEDKSLPEGHPRRVSSDYDRHLHFICPNLTFDPEEKIYKALKVKEIFRLRKWFSHQFDARLSAGLAGLGYELETELKPDAQNGGMEYHTWDIKAAPGHETAMASGKARMSRRNQEIQQTAQGIVAAMKEHDPDAPDALSAVADYKLSRTTRLGKVKDKTLADHRADWDARLTDGEKAAIDATIERAKAGGNPPPENRAAQAMDYAIRHCFYNNSVVEYRELLITAMEKAMGAALPEDLEREARSQGVLFEHGQVSPLARVSTQAVLDQEQRIIGYAHQGRGAFQPLAPGRNDGLDGLSGEQANAVRHVWNSRDAVMLIRGAPGAGKTTTMRPALDRLGVNAVLLAPSSDASRGKLREDGFDEANTVAAFLGESAEGKRMREQARGGLVWIDEASLMPIDDLEKVCGLAKELSARVVLQGDPQQHKSPRRHGNMLTVLADYAGLPVAEINKIQRQKGAYAEAVEAFRAGEHERGVDLLEGLGRIVYGEGHEALVERYAGEVAAGKDRNIILLNPTHRDGAALTERLREVRKAAGLVGGEERTFTRWESLNWSPAQRGDAARYAGDERIQFFRSTGKFKAGQRVTAAELLPHLGEVNPEHFGVFRAGEVAFAVGDKIRITNNGRDVTGKHRVDNGRIDTIRRFDKSGNIELSNGWVISRDFAHLRHGLVSTSPAAQSKDDEHSWVQVNRASLGAVGAEQALVSLSRGKKTGVIFTDLSREELIDAIRRADNRISATELFMPKARPAPVAGPQAAAVEGAADTAARPAAVGGRRPAAVGDADGNAAAREADARAWEFMQRVRGAYRHKDKAAERKAARDGSHKRGDASWEFMQKVRGAYRQLRRKPAAMPKDKARASHAARLNESRQQQGLDHGR